MADILSTRGPGTVCPQCGREQRCGCDVCHACGTELTAGSVSGEASQQTAHHKPLESSEPSSASYEIVDHGRPKTNENTLSAILMLLGVGALIVLVIYTIHTAASFTGSIGSVDVTARTIKSLGYHLAYILNSSATISLLTFALLSAGLLLEPNGPFSSEEMWSFAARLVAAAMFVVSAGYLVSFVLIVLPGGSNSNLIIQRLVPSLPALLPLLAGVGGSFLAGALLLARRSRIGESARV